MSSTEKKVNRKKWIALVFSFIVIGMLVWWLRPSSFPVSNVKIFGNLVYLNEAKVTEIVRGHLTKGFFGVKVSNLRQQLIELPWVVQADVRRVWPGQVVIRIKEHEPAAFWQEDYLISKNAIQFKPESLIEINTSLPHLSGPDKQFNLVWEQYQIFAKRIEPLGLTIKRCYLAPRGAWSIQLSNDIIVVLGTQDVLHRIDRFILAYQKELRFKQERIDYIDMRYTSGMSVGWQQG